MRQVRWGPACCGAADGVVIQADGKIVVAGSGVGTGQDFDSGSDFAVTRYNTDGSLDPTFGGDGKVTTDFASSDDRGFAVALQADGKIVVAGQAFVVDRDFALARYNADGSLDATFGGGDGKVTADLGVGEDDAARAVAIQADGKIVAAGYVRRELFDPTYPADFAVARFNGDGSSDFNFGIGGKVTTDLESDSDQAWGMAIQADGKIVAVGPVLVPSATFDFGLARYNANGSLDTTFDEDGKVTTHFGGSDNAEEVTIQADGKIVAAGARLGDFALARYNINGSLDATFGGGDGKVTTDFGGFDGAEGIAIRGDRRLVAVGCTSCLDASDFAVARYKICRTSSRRLSIPC